MLRSLISSTALLALTACGGPSDGLSREELAFVASAMPHCGAPVATAPAPAASWYECNAFVRFPASVEKLEAIIVGENGVSVFFAKKDAGSPPHLSGGVGVKDGVIVDPKDPEYAAITAKWLVP